MPEFWIFLSSGLFLGWSLGANDGSNVFGTAVGTRMVKFRTAAVISSVFVIIGAVFAGGGAAETLNELGSVNATFLHKLFCKHYHRAFATAVILHIRCNGLLHHKSALAFYIKHFSVDISKIYAI